MFDGTYMTKGLCDRCDHKDGAWNRLTTELTPPGVMENNRWVGGPTTEKVELRRAARCEATKRLTKDCVVIQTDCESVTLCHACLVRLVEEHFGPQGQEKTS